jgi:hypothetical protein
MSNYSDFNRYFYYRKMTNTQWETYQKEKVVNNSFLNVDKCYYLLIRGWTLKTGPYVDQVLPK